MSAPSTHASSKAVVLLTGCSRGLGLSILEQLLTGTAAFVASNVVAISRSLPTELSSVLTAHPDAAVHIQGSTTDEATSQRAVAAALERWGRLDAVVLNAGIVDVGRIADAPLASFAEQLNVNTTSLVATLRAAIPSLRSAEHGGRVVFVSSGAAVGNTAGWGAYNASKAALNAICRTLANEEKELACFAVRPGVVDTDMQGQIRDALSHMAPAEAERFVTMHREGKLLPARLPAHSIAALALNATRAHPKDKDGRGLGEQGAFVNWDAPELDGFKAPQ